MKLPLTYGFGIALVLSLVSLVTHVAGISTNPDRMFLSFGIGIGSLLLVVVTGITLGMRAARADAGPAGFPYGAAFKTGLLITVFAGLGSFLFSLIYFRFIFPDFGDVQIEATRNFMERMNVPSDAIDKAVEDMRAKATVLRQSLNGFAFHLVFGTILSLIVAAIVKRAPTEDLSEPPAIG